MSVILVTHDLGVVAGHTDEIAVMYGGRLVEKAPTTSAVRQHEDAVHRGADGEHPEARAAVATPGSRRSPAGHPISSTRRRAAPSRHAARTPGTAATSSGRRSSPAESPDHVYACWYPVGSPEYLERREALHAAPAAVAAGVGGLDRARDVRGRVLMAGTGKAHLRDTDDVLLRVEDLVVEFPVGRTGLVVNAVSGISLDVRAGRDARPRRRVGLRQEHHRPGHHAAPPPDERLGAVRGQGAHEHGPRRHARGTRRGCR